MALFLIYHAIILSKTSFFFFFFEVLIWFLKFHRWSRYQAGSGLMKTLFEIYQSNNWVFSINAADVWKLNLFYLATCIPTFTFWYMNCANRNLYCIYVRFVYLFRTSLFCSASTKISKSLKSIFYVYEDFFFDQL